jgi:hypothetical protein
MEPPATGRFAAGHCAIRHEELLVHNWRVTQLRRLGIPGSLAETYADRIDWHQVARLVHHGCPPRLALRIVR